MEFTELDRNALYDIWMSQKAKMHITQMEMAKRLGLSLHEFSGLLRGNSPLTLGFIKQLCEQLHVRPGQVIPSLTERELSAAGSVHLQNRVTVVVTFAMCSLRATKSSLSTFTKLASLLVKLSG